SWQRGAARTRNGRAGFSCPSAMRGSTKRRGRFASTCRHGNAFPFDPDEFERMSPEQADEYERRVLATCCPEIGFHRDGRPDYARLQQFTCPVWLRAPID